MLALLVLLTRSWANILTYQVLQPNWKTTSVGWVTTSTRRFHGALQSGSVIWDGPMVIKGILDEEDAKASP
ncbi:hypothetical protein O9929_14740 [Vibrio lentus]|nr:hypothetical protein [Vibrio lentus]